MSRRAASLASLAVVLAAAAPARAQRRAAGAPARGAPPAAPRARAADDEPGVTVRAARPPREATRVTLERREIARLPGSFGDALRSIQNLPGLARAPFFSGSLIVRGSPPADTQVFADGTVVPLLYHFGGLGSTIQTDMLDRIDFYPGNFSARFGRAAGGAVDIGLRSPRARGWRGSASIGFIDAGVVVEGALTPTLSLAVGTRYGWIGALLGAVATQPDGSGFGVTYWDYQGVLEWRPSPATRVRLALFGDYDELTIRLPRSAPAPGEVQPAEMRQGPRLAVGYHIAQLSLTHDLAAGTQLRAMLSAAWTDTSITNQDEGLRLTAVPVQLRYELAHRVNPAARVNFGVDLIVGPADASVPIGGPEFVGGAGGAMSRNRVVNTVVYQPGLYVEAELTPTRTLRIVPGVRFDYARSVRQAVLAPRVSARWEVAPGWALRGGVGQFAQPTRVNENNVFPLETLVGNSGAFGMKRAMHYSLGGERRIGSALTVSLEGFYRWYDGVMVGFPTTDQFLTAEPQVDRPVATTGVGYALGAEVLVRARVSERWFGWVAYTLMRAERRDAPGERWRPFEFDQTHNLTVVGSYQLGAGWEAGLRFRYVTGRAYTPYVSYYDAAELRYAQTPGVEGSVRLPDFHQLDVRIEKRFAVGRGALSLFLEVLNVYNQANTEGLLFSPDSTRTTRLPGLPFVPNLGLRGEL